MDAATRIHSIDAGRGRCFAVLRAESLRWPGSSTGGRTRSGGPACAGYVQVPFRRGIYRHSGTCDRAVFPEILSGSDCDGTADAPRGPSPLRVDDGFVAAV